MDADLGEKKDDLVPSDKLEKHAQKLTELKDRKHEVEQQYAEDRDDKHHHPVARVANKIELGANKLRRHHEKRVMTREAQGLVGMEPHRVRKTTEGSAEQKDGLAQLSSTLIDEGHTPAVASIMGEDWPESTSKSAQQYTQVSEGARQLGLKSGGDGKKHETGSIVGELGEGVLETAKAIGGPEMEEKVKVPELGLDAFNLGGDVAGVAKDAKKLYDVHQQKGSLPEEERKDQKKEALRAWARTRCRRWAMVSRRWPTPWTTPR